MSVPKVSSGDTITKAGIEAMHEAVRTIINDTAPEHLQRRAFGSQHVPTLVVGSGGLNVDPGGTINTIGVNESEADILANWQQMTNFDLDNGGLGYALPPCWVVYWVTIQPGALSAVNSIDDLWGFCLYHEEDVGAGTVVVLDEYNTGWVHSNIAFDNVNDPVTIFVFHDASGYAGNWTLERIRLRACKMDVSGGAVPDLNLANGTVGFIALYSGS
jgi:hypothetical protein